MITTRLLQNSSPTSWTFALSYISHITASHTLMIRQPSLSLVGAGEICSSTCKTHNFSYQYIVVNFTSLIWYLRTYTFWLDFMHWTTHITSCIRWHNHKINVSTCTLQFSLQSHSQFLLSTLYPHF